MQAAAENQQTAILPERMLAKVGATIEAWASRQSRSGTLRARYSRMQSSSMRNWGTCFSCGVPRQSRPRSDYQPR